MSDRKWTIEWPIPDALPVGELRQIITDLRGFGATSMTTNEDVPDKLHAEFTTSEEWNEFDLGSLLYEIANSYPGNGFPTRPTEIPT